MNKYLYIDHRKPRRVKSATNFNDGVIYPASTLSDQGTVKYVRASQYEKAISELKKLQAVDVLKELGELSEH